MKIIVFSDSHGELEGMRKVIDREQPDYVFHLGDHDLDAERLGEEHFTLPVTAVRGNCDGWTDTPLTRIVSLGGLRFFLCHGHTLGVRGGLLRATYAALEQRCGVLLFGHTHEPVCECANQGTDRAPWILNPGSCGLGHPPTYGRIVLEKGKEPEFGICRV